MVIHFSLPTVPGSNSVAIGIGIGLTVAVIVLALVTTAIVVVVVLLLRRKKKKEFYFIRPRSALATSGLTNSVSTTGKRGAIHYLMNLGVVS